MEQRSPAPVHSSVLPSRDDGVSVIIPAYRANATIQRAVDSVLTQTLEPREVIVVDDGSPEPLAPTLERYSGRVRLLRQQNAGPSAARNAGMDAAAGDLLAFLDADDYWEPHKLERQVSLHRRTPRIGFSFAMNWLQQADSTKDSRRERRLTLSHPPGSAFVVSGAEAMDYAAVAWTGTVMLTRTRLGDERFAPEFRTAEDRDLWFRLIQAGPIAYLDEYLATLVLEPDSLSRGNISRDYENMLRVLDKHSAVLGPAAHRRWQARVYRAWTAALLGSQRPKEALGPALQRWLLEPLSAEAARIVALSSLRTAKSALRRPK